MPVPLIFQSPDTTTPLPPAPAPREPQDDGPVEPSSLHDIADVERHLREVDRVIADAERAIGRPVGSGQTPEEKEDDLRIKDLYADRRQLRSRRAELSDLIRQQGSSPRQRAMRRLADLHPEEFTRLVREEKDRRE